MVRFTYKVLLPDVCCLIPQFHNGTRANGLEVCTQCRFRFFEAGGERSQSSFGTKPSSDSELLDVRFSLHGRLLKFAIVNG